MKRHMASHSRDPNRGMHTAANSNMQMQSVIINANSDHVSILFGLPFSQIFSVSGTMFECRLQLFLLSVN